MKSLSPLRGVLLVCLCLGLGLPGWVRCSPEEEVIARMLELVSTGQGYLNHTAVRSLFIQLERRVQCPGVSCEKCRPLDSLDQLVGNYSGGGLGAEQFYRVAGGCSLYLSNPTHTCEAMREGRWGEETDLLFRRITHQEKQQEEEQLLDAGQHVDPAGLDSLLQDIELHYTPIHHQQCLTSHEILDEVNMWSSGHSDVAVVMGSIVYHAVCGDCLTGHALPHESYFLDFIMQRLGNDNITVSDLEALMEGLKLGERHEDEHHEHHRLLPEDLHTHQDNSHLDHSHQDHRHHEHSHQDNSHSDHSHQDNSHRGHSHQDHNHTKESKGRNSSWDQMCLTAQQLIHIHGLNESGLVRPDLARLSPALLQQLLSGACSVPLPPEPSDILTTTERFVYASIANLLISLTSTFGIVLLLCTSYSNVFQLCIQFCVSLAVGSLTGDALLHLLPTVLGLHSHDGESSEHIYKLLVVMAGLYFFYLMEIIFSIVTKKKDHHHREGEEPHHCDHGHVLEMYQQEKKGKWSASKTDLVYGEDDEKSVSQKEELSKEKKLLPVMITLGDAIHNFADGLAIGAAFSVSWKSGLATSLAVLCHELPHELGDFAILLHCGMSVRRAMLLNVGCAMTSFVGLYVALSIATNLATNQWIAAVTTGLFLYVGLADMLPTMVHVDSRHPWLMFLLQNVGLLSGWGILLLLSLYEGRITF